MPRILALAAGLAILPVAEVRAQVVTLDEGTFRITVDGRNVGSESFQIRRSGSGEAAQVIATAEIRMEVPEGRIDLRPALQASGAEMAVTAYQIKVSGGIQEEITVTLGDRRFRSSIRSERGEREREFRAAPGTLLLDLGVAHQYYFLGARIGSESVTIPVISPRQGTQFDLRVSPVGTQSIRIGDADVQARHLRLEGEGGVRELWIDAEGRVLRVDVPEQGYVALRERAP
jgi:hypothetical protein